MTTKRNNLGTFSLWAIGVGLVISGMSFGWNLGWGIVGPIAFFIPFFIAALLYFGLTRCLIFLGRRHIDIDTPEGYIFKTHNLFWSKVVGFSILIEFLFATPAVANSIGEYLGFLSGETNSSSLIGSLFIILFGLLNIFKVKFKVWISISLTLLAIAELFLYTGSIVPEFRFNNFSSTIHNDFNILSLTKALPYAIWMFLAIEGLTLYIKYIDKSNFRTILKNGYNYSYFTLLFLSFLILFLTIGCIQWNETNWSIISVDSHPMPQALSLILSKEDIVVKAFTFIGLFGLIASLQGVSFAVTEQIKGYMENTKLNSSSKQVIASFTVILVSLIAIWSNQASFLIEFSVFGAVCLYIGIAFSSLVIKKDEPINGNMELNNSNVLFTKIFAFITIAISLISVLAFANTQRVSFLICLFVGVAYYIFYKFKRKK